MRAGFLLLSILAGAAPFTARGEVDYLRDIKPLLARRCYTCHGPLRQKGGLRVDTAALMRRGGEHGSILGAPPAAAPLLDRVTATDPQRRMPRDSEALPPQEISLLREWLALGAPAPPGEQAGNDPREHWAFQAPRRPDRPGKPGGGNPIDELIAAELLPRGLTAAPPARPEQQVRRLYLDLLGLPPSGAELGASLSDNAPGAWDRLVDRLLADPRHGERWARHWMDVWRYSDWFGRRLVPDVWNSAPQIWRWRDWIVRSLNADKGYDRMIHEMLAGDEIAPGSPETLVATGFLVRNWDALNPNQWMRDNVEHTGKAFLGLSFNCAHCHDHKYDPISREDYFSFRAFFEPLYLRQDRWAAEPDPGKFQDYEYVKVRKVVRTGMVSAFDRDPAAPTWLYTGGDERNRETNRPPATPRMPALLGGDSIRPVPVRQPAESVYPALRESSRREDLAAAAKAIAQAHQGWETAVARSREARAALVNAGGGPSRHLARTAEEQAATLVALEDARFQAAVRARVSLEARMAADDVRHGGKSGDLPALTKAASEAERAAAAAAAHLAVLEAEQVVANAAARLRDAPDGKQRDDAASAHKKALGQRDAARLALAKAEAELKKPAGDYTPLSPVYPRESTGRRRALAEWITSRQNPLTARVAVNHLWARHFHAPLVASMDDFGRNGARPTHPALLDWLAVEFMESGWSMKRLHRLIVTSEAYRRSSAAADPASAARDPENRFLWRAHAGRMEAEVVRDSILHLAGALDARMGGQELENGDMPRSTRRTLYFACHPELGGRGEFTALFDAPDPTECYRRPRTVMPQQALALTNSKLVHDHSTPLARRIEAGAGGNPQDAEFIAAAFREILSRRPGVGEEQACAAFLSRQARETGGQAAARDSLVRVLLNHNDFVTIR